MTIPEILRELEPYTENSRCRQCDAAIEQREAITPELLHVLRFLLDESPLAKALGHMSGARAYARPKGLTAAMAVRVPVFA